MSVSSCDSFARLPTGRRECAPKLRSAASASASEAAHQHLQAPDVRLLGGLQWDYGAIRRHGEAAVHGRRRPYFRLSFDVVFTCWHFLRARPDRKSQVCRRNCSDICHSVGDISTSGLDGHIAISSYPSCRIYLWTLSLNLAKTALGVILPPRCLDKG